MYPKSEFCVDVLMPWQMSVNVKVSLQYIWTVLLKFVLLFKPIGVFLDECHMPQMQTCTCPSVHASIILGYLDSGQRPEQASPDFSLPSYFVQIQMIFVAAQPFLLVFHNKAASCCRSLLLSSPCGCSARSSVLRRVFADRLVASFSTQNTHKGLIQFSLRHILGNSL